MTHEDRILEMLLPKPAVQTMDEYTEGHLEAWLDAHICMDERATVEANMRGLIASDPDLIDRGWARVRDLADTIYN
ncbi:MAG: hypothetical protein Q7O66_07250 [Dehalococcoidia bacterium]|nr:hypothetical protein [Dehalococcoidia bacterium]